MVSESWTGWCLVGTLLKCRVQSWRHLIPLSKRWWFNGMKKEMEIQLAQIKIVNSLSELDTKQQTKGRQPIRSAFSSLNTCLVLQIQV